MTFEYANIENFNIGDAVKDSLMSAMSFIFEHHVAIKMEKCDADRTIAGITYGKYTGEYSAGPSLYGSIAFQYVDDIESSVCSVDEIVVDMGDLGSSVIPFTSDATLYDALLNKHKLHTKLQQTKPIRMKRVVDACQKLKEIHDDGAPNIQDQITPLVDSILKEIQ